MGNAVCTVCHDKLSESLENCVATECGHIFHPKCLAEWNARSPLCPFCAGNAGRNIRLFMVGDGEELDVQLERWHELIESAIEFLAQRSSRSKINRKENFEALFDFLKMLENNEYMNQHANFELLRKIVSLIISTNANISDLLLELESQQEREIILQRKIKQIQMTKQQKYETNGAETVCTTNGIWTVQDFN